MLILADEPHQAKPDPYFPKLKLFVNPDVCKSTVQPNADKIGPANLDKNAARFKSYPTVFYVFGFLDASSVQNYSSPLHIP